MKQERMLTEIQLFATTSAYAWTLLDETEQSRDLSHQRRLLYLRSEPPASKKNKIGRQPLSCLLKLLVHDVGCF